MKVFSLSNCFYYREFSDLKNTVLHDLDVYNRVLHKAYKCLYDRAYKGAAFKDSELHQFLKKQFHLNDYIPLSAVHEAKALLKANAALNKKLIRKTEKRMNRIRMKIREFSVIETVGKRKDFHDASLTEMRCFVHILYHINNYNDTIISN